MDATSSDETELARLVKFVRARVVEGVPDRFAAMLSGLADQLDDTDHPFFDEERFRDAVAFLVAAAWSDHPDWRQQWAPGGVRLAI